MRLFDCKSSTVAKFGYDRKERKMYFKFHGRDTIYEYKDVPPEVLTEFIASPSKGKFHLQRIKGNYEYTAYD